MYITMDINLISINGGWVKKQANLVLQPTTVAVFIISAILVSPPKAIIK